MNIIAIALLVLFAYVSGLFLCEQQTVAKIVAITNGLA